MRAGKVEASGFRNIEALELALPSRGAVLLGPNGHGKTNLLEAIYYPVLFRSLRGARDVDLVRFGEPGFHVRLTVASRSGPHEIEAGFMTAGRRKRIAVDGAEPSRVTEALGTWLAVAFLPGDVGLVSGGASERRQFLDRVLALSDPGYLRALRRYRAALDQRNAALRSGVQDAAWAFDDLVATAGAVVVASRLAWVARFGPVWAAACATLGETGPAALSYRGRTELALPAAWTDVLRNQRSRDLATGATNCGPHRDDLQLELDGTPLKVSGSTGQQRTAAVALKLCERDTIEASHGEPPALLLDDVFAELDRERQDRLADIIGIGEDRQVFVTAPRADELPPGLGLPVLAVADGRVAAPAGVAEE